MSKETTAPLLVERIGSHVVLLTMNRPEAHNAVNGPMARAMAAAVAETEADESVRVVVLAANGKSYCAGADLKEVARGNGHELSIAGSGFGGLVQTKRRKPWIAAVQGPALGGGMEFALACDMVVASERATFALPEVRRGLIAGAGGAFRIAHALPRAIAIEVVTLGAPLTADRAHALGLVNRVVPPDALIDEALALASGIAANSPQAVRESLAIVRRSADGDEDADWQDLDSAMARILAGPDWMEGATAFVEKRDPVWRT